MIKAVIFDVGRVILPIDWSLVIQALGLSEKEGHQLGHQVATGKFYDQYERGEISTEEFFKGFDREYGLGHSTEEIRSAWMQLILPPFQGIDEVLKTLSQNTEVFALSNTNEAHSQFFMKEFEVFSHFHEIFTSHGLNSRKPEKEIYQQVLKLTGKQPQETLFFDDLLINVEAARSLGMNAERVEGSVDEIKRFLKKYQL